MTTQFANEPINNRRTTNLLRSSNTIIERDPFHYEIRPAADFQNQHRSNANSIHQEVLTSKLPRIPYGQNVGQVQINRRVGPPTNPAAFPARSSPTRPLRIIIIRHAERVDAVLGSDWSRKSFDRSGRYIRFSEHLPENLPNRSYLHHYVIDVPLTNRGRVHAFKTGKALLINGYAPDFCYSSPSLRCVQTADGLLNGMSRKNVPIQLEPGLFECYLNDFKRTLCFMTKDELAGNGYNIDKNYQVLMPFMRPHDSQLDYYERSRTIMDLIIERHQQTGGTVLIVGHAPSLEGLTRHLTGGKLHPERLFDIARRVPFLAMTIVERNSLDGQWLFRTQPLQTGQTASMRELAIELTQPMNIQPVAPTLINKNPYPPAVKTVATAATATAVPSPPPSTTTTTIQRVTLPPIDNHRVRPTGQIISVDPKKVVKSSTEPNLRQSHSMTNIFRVI